MERRVRTHHTVRAGSCFVLGAVHVQHDRHAVTGADGGVAGCCNGCDYRVCLYRGPSGMNR